MFLVFHGNDNSSDKQQPVIHFSCFFSKGNSDYKQRSHFLSTFDHAIAAQVASLSFSFPIIAQKPSCAPPLSLQPPPRDPFVRNTWPSLLNPERQQKQGRGGFAFCLTSQLLVQGPPRSHGQGLDELGELDASVLRRERRGGETVRE